MYVCMYVCVYAVVVVVVVSLAQSLRSQSSRPTPLAVRRGLFSCEFLAQLQEFCLHSSQCLVSAQASWLCQVHVTAWRQEENLHFCMLCDRLTDESFCRQRPL